MITVHLNGVATPLHTLSLASTDEFVDRYAFDSVLTSLIAITLSSTISPTSSTQVLSIEKYCDPGEKKIPLLYNHKYLEENRYQGTTKMTKNENWMPCTLYTREGVAVFDVLGNSWNNKNLASKFRETSVPLTNLNVYLVPAGRNFMFAPFTVGETFDLSHVTNSPDSKLPISLTTLSVSPKVFEVNNFFSLAESDKIIENALTQKSESHKLKRSSTGADGYNTNPTRTSENAFDTHSVVAVDIKKRCFETLGFPSYEDDMADGLQILRYNVSKAYISHLDWIDDSPSNAHDFNSDGVGSNRFATILLYFSDLEEGQGGETVFAKGWPADLPEEERVSDINEAKRIAGEKGNLALFKKGSWEEKLVAQCATRLTTRPQRAKAVLFYSQEPDGTPEQMSLHGACPVQYGSKWAANLWVWNAPRMGYPAAPNKEIPNSNGGKTKGKPKPKTAKAKAKDKAKAKGAKEGQITMKFYNSGQTHSGVRLYWKKSQLEEESWGVLVKGEDKTVYTYPGHVWVLKHPTDDGIVLKTVVVGTEHEGKFLNEI